MKKLLTSALLLAIPMLASAYDALIDGIYYNLNSEVKTAEVTYLFNDNGGYSGSYDIPKTIIYDGEEYSVTAIGDKAFQSCRNVSSITIPNSVTTIGGMAFYNCNNLIIMDIPNSVTTIGNSAFSGCQGLTSITIPNSVTSIGSYAFQQCLRLTSVTIPNSVTTIGNGVFLGCSNLTSVTLPNSMTCIGNSFFQGCSNLTSITIPKSVTTIEKGAFSWCSFLDSVTIPNSVTSIGEEAFYRCTNLKSVIIPNSVTSIGVYAFGDCTSLTSLTIPNSVTSIGDHTFYGCTGFTSFTIPNSITTIENSTFYRCSNLTTLIIPNSVNYIGSYAFRDCSKLEEVYCYAENLPSTSSTAFENSNHKKATLYVPAKSLNDYENTLPWSEFGMKKAIAGSEEGANKCATPIISYADKKLTFSCETEGVEYHYTITDSDIKSDVSSSIDLTATYEISVYATKSGYTNSDVATATLVWTDAIFTVTTPETPTSAKVIAESIPVLISAKGGVITVKGEQEGQAVAVYTTDGKAIGSTTMKDGQVSITTNLQRGEIAVVKVGLKSVKIKM